MRIERASVTSTTNAIAKRTIRPAVIGTTSSFGDQRRGAVDPQDIYARARLEHLPVVVGAGGPDLASDLHLPVVGVHALDDHRPLPDERGAARPQRSRHVHV